MADNTILPGTGEVYASDDRGGVNYQKVLIEASNGRSHSVDAAGRWRVSQPKTLHSTKLIFGDKAPLYWGEATETGAGVTASMPTSSKPYIDVVSTISTAAKWTRQTFQRFNYQTGKSQLIKMTGVIDLTASGTETQKGIGCYDDDNGIFFNNEAGTVYAIVRTSDSGSPVNAMKVAQADWNFDRMDGSGGANNPSGITIDWTKEQLFFFDFQWLSSGPVKFGLEIDGKVYYVHTFGSANSLQIPWCATPNLPLRYQMITTANSPATSMRVICAAIVSEGGQDPIGTPHTVANTLHVNANTTNVFYALVGIRLKSVAFGCEIDQKAISVIAKTNDQFEWVLLRNPSVAGTFDFTDHEDSCVQEAIGDTTNPSENIVTGGNEIARGFGAAKDSATIPSDASLDLGAAIDGTPDTMVLAVRSLGSNSDFLGSIGWNELR